MENRYSDAALTINLAAIAHNYKYFREITSPSECGAVVKADAYGLGIEPVSTRLHQEGCRKFFVANLDEALKLATILDDNVTEIFVFHGIKKGEEKEFLNKNIIPILNTPEQLEIWNNFGNNKSLKLPSVIHIDTGINRLGMNYKEAQEIKREHQPH